MEKRQTGKKKGINELSEREKRAKRKKWREAKRKARARASALLQLEIPPNSPNIPEAPENQPEPGPSRLEHGSLDTEFIRKFRFI